MEAQIANLVQQVQALTAGLEQERALRANAEAQIQRLHDEGVARDAVATQSKDALQAHIDMLKASASWIRVYSESPNGSTGLTRPGVTGSSRRSLTSAPPTAA